MLTDSALGNAKLLKRRVRNQLLGLAVSPLALISRRGFLHDMGWYQSVRTQRSIDLEGNPIPWWSYSFILFLRDRLNAQLRVFEFGSGNSTLWLAPRVKSVISIETDKEWYERVRVAVPQNVELRYEEFVRDGNYCRMLEQYPSQFDVIIVDAFDRVRCAKNAMAALNPGGVIIFDDASDAPFHDGPAFLVAHGFKRLDFIGTAPQQDATHCTTLFYRNENCLGV